MSTKSSENNWTAPTGAMTDGDIISNLNGVAGMLEQNSQKNAAGMVDDGRNRLEALTAERDALRQEVARQSHLLQDKFNRETLITGIDVTNGGLTIGAQGGAAKILAESFAAMFKDGGGVNYLEMTFKSTQIAPDESFVVTVRHCAGKTPHTLRAEAEADRDRLAAEVLRLADAVMESDARGARLMSLLERIRDDSAWRHRSTAEGWRAMSELKRYDYAVQHLLRMFWLDGYKGCESGARPVVGDLVMLQSAPDGPWHLSFYREHLGTDNHLLESLKTGDLCRWSNVGFTVISRKWQAEHPRVRWTDEQFAFSRKVDAEIRRGDYYITIPGLPADTFTPESAVVATRTRFSLDGITTRSDPFDWRTLNRGDIRRLLAKQVRVHNGARKAQKDTTHGE